jgi:predicted nuclease of predicted toxin-antitoxin system
VKLLADEGVDRQIVERLRRDGHEVLYIAEIEPGVDDGAILARAAESNSLLLTADKDFGELIFRQGRASGGILLIRLAGLSADAKAEATVAALAMHGQEMGKAFAVVTPGVVRIRRNVS